VDVPQEVPRVKASFRSPEQERFAEAVSEFARRELAAAALERAHEPAYSFELAQQLSRQGLIGLTVPLEDGGHGGSLLDAVIAICEIGRVCPKSADVVQAGNFGALRTFSEYASEEQKQRFLPYFLTGDALLALAMSEPEAGSAVTDLRTSVRPDGREWLIDGTKVWSTHSVDATHYLVYVRFAPGTGGIGCVLVERNRPGLEVGAASEYMSGERWAPLYFDACRIPDENILLGPGGFRKQMNGFNVERLGNAARSVALGRLAFDEARAYARRRQQFGRDLVEFQGIQWKFAEMAVALDTAQLMLEGVAKSAETALPSAYDTAVAKYASNQAGFFAANESLQVMGATGYSTDTLVEYCLRRTRGWMIAGGSTEMLKIRIAESVLDRRFNQRGLR
jgi:alkylation response protein AidB-like acyl-CoA dehydrogenase